MDDNNKLKKLAAQFAKPNAEKGIELAAMMSKTNIEMTRHSLHKLTLTGSEHILELGHGNAAHLNELLTQYPSLHYTGLETSKTMYEEASRLNEMWIDQGRANFLHYDGKHLPLKAKTFDKIFSVNTIYFWKDRFTFLSKLKNLLSNNGQIALTFANKKFMQTLPFTVYGFTLYDVEDAERLLEQCDFKNIKSSIKKEYILSPTNEPIEREYATVTAYNN